MSDDSPPTPAPHDRSAEWFLRLARFALRHVVYHAVYPSKVVTQASDGTLELQPDSVLMPGIKGVPIRLGVPGVKVKVKPGARVALGFENGDPKKPYAGFWEPDQLDSISFSGATSLDVDAPTVNLVPSGGLPNARQGDMVAVGGPGMTPVPVALVLTSPLPTTPPVPAGTPIACTMALLQPVYGLVSSGNPNVTS